MNKSRTRRRLGDPISYVPLFLRERDLMCLMYWLCRTTSGEGDMSPNGMEAGQSVSFLEYSVLTTHFAWPLSCICFAKLSFRFCTAARSFRGSDSGRPGRKIAGSS